MFLLFTVIDDEPQTSMLAFIDKSRTFIYQDYHCNLIDAWLTMN